MLEEAAHMFNMIGDSVFIVSIVYSAYIGVKGVALYIETIKRSKGRREE